MKKAKTYFLVFLLFLLLVAVAVIPPVLTKYQNQKLIDQETVEELPEDVKADKEEGEQNLWKRLQILKESVVVKMSSSEEGLTAEAFAEREKQLVERMEQELQTLQEMGALPAVSFSEEYEAKKVEKKTYLNMENPAEVLGIWRILVEYPDFLAEVYMDAETSALYEVSMISKTEFACNMGDLSMSRFLDYLVGYSEIPKEEDEWFDVSGYYSRTEAYLFIISVDMETQLSVSYNLSDRFLKEPYYSVDYGRDDGGAFVSDAAG